MKNNGSGHRRNIKIPDYTGDRYWAEELAKRIQSYWHQKGYRNVRTWVETEVSSFGNRIHGVRSNISYNCRDIYKITH